VTLESDHMFLFFFQVLRHPRAIKINNSIEFTSNRRCEINYHVKRYIIYLGTHEYVITVVKKKQNACQDDKKKTDEFFYKIHF